MELTRRSKDCYVFLVTSKDVGIGRWGKFIPHIYDKSILSTMAAILLGSYIDFLTLVASIKYLHLWFIFPEYFIHH